MRLFRDVETESRAGRLLTLVLYAGLAASALFGFYLAWFRLNVAQLDASGHLASARLFHDGMFHRFVDSFFLGYVQNLFYPPLEDLTLAVLGHLAGGDFLTGYRVYLCVLVVAYLGSAIYFAGLFRSAAARNVFLLLFLALIHLDKPNLAFLQGLSFLDIFVTGLTAEVLGGIFLLILLRRLIEGGSTLAVAALLALCLLSHLVTGPVAMLCVVTFAFVRLDGGHARAAALALLLCGFFFVPAVAYRGALFSSTIFHTLPLFITILLAYGATLLGRGDRVFPLAIAGLLLSVPAEIRSLSRATIPAGWVPDYHYYRLAVFAVLFLAVVAAAALDAAPRGTRRRALAMLTVAVLLIGGARTFRLQTYARDDDSYLDGERREWRLPADPAGKRVWSISPDRPCDFHADTLSLTLGSDAAFVKGLYWESSRHNVLLSSYLATVLRPEQLVLDNAHYRPRGCSGLACAVDHFIRDYSIGWVLAAAPAEVEYLGQQQAFCYENMFEQGTSRFRFEFLDRQRLPDADYALYRIEPRSPGSDNAVVEIVDPACLEVEEAPALQASGHRIDAVERACRDGALACSVPVTSDSRRRILSRLARSPGDPPSSPSARFARIDHGHYRIDVDSDRDVLFKVKLNPMPGLTLLDDRGRKVPIHETLGGFVAVGRGGLELVYRRPPAMLAGYVVSLLTLAALAVGALARLVRRRASSPARMPARPLEALRGPS